MCGQPGKPVFFGTLFAISDAHVGKKTPTWVSCIARQRDMMLVISWKADSNRLMIVIPTSYNATDDAERPGEARRGAVLCVNSARHSSFHQLRCTPDHWQPEPITRQTTWGLIPYSV